MNKRRQSPIDLADIPAAAKSQDVPVIVSDVDGNIISQTTRAVEAKSCIAIVRGNSKQFVPAGKIDEFFNALSSDEEDNGPKVARIIKLDPQTGLPQWGSDFSPVYITQEQLTRVVTAGLII